ncbi:MAG: ABC transporter permease [Bacteroidota bacterium]|jgi:ABC-2 type transport system permease protein
MLALLWIELNKIFRRPRTYIAFGAMAAIVWLIQLALYFDGQAYVDLLLSNLSGSFEFSDLFKTQLLNGYLICFVILNTLLIQMPLLVALVAGDSIAGEASQGTLRFQLTRPISRAQLIFVKFAASVVYVLCLLLWLALLALLGSVLLFGVNDLVVLRSTGIEQMQMGDVFWRYLAAFGFAAIALTTVAALSLLLSVLSENPIGPIIATMSVVLVFTILSEMNIPIYDTTVKPWLFTTHMVAWKGFFYVQADAEGATVRGSVENLPAVLRSAAILLGYIALFLWTSIYLFRRKDILT